MYRIFGHYVPKTMFIFGLFEALVLLVSVHLALLIGLQWGYLDFSIQASYSSLPLNTVFFICVMQAAMFAMGLYSRDLRDRPRLVMLRIALSFGPGFTGIEIHRSAVSYPLPGAGYAAGCSELFISGDPVQSFVVVPTY